VEEEPPKVFEDETVEKFRREGHGWLKELDEISGPDTGKKTDLNVDYKKEQDTLKKWTNP
jgi:hypothetical protein